VVIALRRVICRIVVVDELSRHLHVWLLRPKKQLQLRLADWACRLVFVLNGLLIGRNDLGLLGLLRFG